MPGRTETVPCQYKTGKTLGEGTYSVIKEAVSIKTGAFYACKIIDKKLMNGREYLVKNEISALKKVSRSHRNIITLHDYFETTHRLYLCFDLCTGGELYDRIYDKGKYPEKGAARLVRSIFDAVTYIHDAGIIHCDLKPENILFKDPSEDADIMVCDFGISKVVDSNTAPLTDVCGTTAYMAPEVLFKTGYHKPVDIWAVGVITYFLLCGYLPFRWDAVPEEENETRAMKKLRERKEEEAIKAGDYKFEPDEYWENISEAAKDFIKRCLAMDPAKRPSVWEILEHKWLSNGVPYFVTEVKMNDFDAKRTFRKAVFAVIATDRMSTLASLSSGAENINCDLRRYEKGSKQAQEVLFTEIAKLSINESKAA